MLVLLLLTLPPMFALAGLVILTGTIPGVLETQKRRAMLYLAGEVIFLLTVWWVCNVLGPSLPGQHGLYSRDNPSVCLNCYNRGAEARVRFSGASLLATGNRTQSPQVTCSGARRRGKALEFTQLRDSRRRSRRERLELRGGNGG